MSICNLPFTICRLTDKNGNLVNPYAPGSITFTASCSSKKCEETEPGTTHEKNEVTVSVGGYITVFVEGKEFSQPIPFNIIQRICIDTQEDTFLDFTVMGFRCDSVPVMSGDEKAVDQVTIFVELDTAVRSCAYVDVMVEAAIPPCPDIRELCIIAKRVFDCVCFRSGTSIVYSLLLKAAVSQYNALSDGVEKNYTNADELTEYGHVGILSPDAVSYHDVQINAMLQPDVNYTMTAGHLDLLTDDAPIAGAPVIITYVALGENHGKAVNVINEYYVTASTGTTQVFTDSDAILMYGDKGIPSPDAVSFFNLYVNGALQPKVNYTVEEGLLQLTTSDIPMAGAMITLESLIIKDSDDTLLNAEVYAYNALSDGKKIYTDSDEIRIYGSEGIPDPATNSYMNLFINGVIQPPVNYSVQKGILTLNTQDAPINGAPVTLQVVRAYMS